MLVQFCIARHDNSKISLLFNSLEVTVTILLSYLTGERFLDIVEMAHFCMLKANFQITLHIVIDCLCQPAVKRSHLQILLCKGTWRHFPKRKHFLQCVGQLVLFYFDSNKIHFPLFDCTHRLSHGFITVRGICIAELRLISLALANE